MITHITVYEPEQHIVIYRGKTSKRYNSIKQSSVRRLSNLLYNCYSQGKVSHKVFMGIHDYEIV